MKDFVTTLLNPEVLIIMTMGVRGCSKRCDVIYGRPLNRLANIMLHLVINVTNVCFFRYLNKFWKRF